ncbi:MAG: hypothetical protein M3Q44_07585 [bacterium]|nr:hypothetical protein [bacterium]
MDTSAQNTNSPASATSEVISPAIRDFLKSYDLEKQASAESQNTGNIQVSRAASALAVVFEKVRQVIDYQEETVLRRKAIGRILLRRITSAKNGERSIAEGLIKEITWAHYIDNNILPQERIDEVAEIIKRYKVLLERNTYKQTKKLPELRDWIIGVMSAEIEQLLVPHYTTDALVQLMYLSLDHSESAPDVDEATKNLQVFLTIHRCLLKSDDAVLRFKLLTSYYPDWTKNIPELTEQVATQFIQAVEAIEYHLKHPLGERLLPVIRRQTAPFLILKSVVDKNKKKRYEILADHVQREEVITGECEIRYKTVSQKITRAATRSIIYLFITKITLAFILEVPADQLIHGSIQAVPLLINIIFPPLLMFIVALSIRPPDKKNTEKIMERVNALMDDPDGRNALKLKIPLPKRRSNVFVYVYAAMFIISFGLIWILLSKMHFNFVSKGLFFLFTCLVSFFAFRIRQTATELMVTGEKESFLTAIIDFFFLPFLRVGRWLSSAFSKVNIFIFIFDFILEAPLKSLIAIAEEWFTFIREKKDEIV